ncbi:uncharacterized protein N7483_000426 [Penicillium malachiteum]|uniref:uncharacterized protein n=1 Tax=Penicillium malachiteum TaxID=1324776 RepID=UPI0025488649|nr:uncharacterized protein N7483_000426 [Penicillium malachiteum]KAJ5735301.1 hypothetical protein N7483_000426 [Penicillium malachiteum]
MRTRSQPLSPGGLKSLDDLPRRRRATRSASVTEPTNTTTTTTKSEKPKSTARGRKPRAKKIVGRKKVKKSNPAETTLRLLTILKTKKTDGDSEVVESKNSVLEETVSAANEQPLARSSEQTPKKSPSRLDNNKQKSAQASDQEPTSPFTIAKKAKSPKKTTEHDLPSGLGNTRPSKVTPRTPSRHKTPLRAQNATLIVRRSRVPYSTIASRRRSVAGGHVSQTLFRLPDLINQAALIEPSPETRPSHFEENPESDPALPTTPVSKNFTASNIPQTAPAARVGSSPGWSRWIFDSVSRRWSTMRGRLDFNKAHDSQLAPTEGEPSAPEPESPSSSPSSFRSSRRMHIRSAATTTTNTAYSLRPAGFSAELIEKCFPSLPPAEVAARVRRFSNSGSGLLPSDMDLGSEEQSKKRKRPPSPETIPNPPGCSYGINDEYFEFDSDDEEWATEEQARRDALVQDKSATEKTEGPAAKKQRVEESAPNRRRHVLYANTPRKAEKRPGYDRNRPHRLNRPTTLPTVESSEFLHDPSSGGSPIVRGGGRNSQNTAGWIVKNPHGTFQTPGWDSASSDEPVLDETPADEQPVVLNETPAKPDTPSQAAVSPHATTILPGSDNETADDPSPLSKARNKAEQFKPKTPSRLREAHPFMKSPATASPNNGPRHTFHDAHPFLHAPVPATKAPAAARAAPEATPLSSQKPLSSSPAVATNSPHNARLGTSPFVGNDSMSVDGSSYIKPAETEFDPANDSLSGMEESGDMGTEWLLYECPDGNFGSLKWPSQTRLHGIFSANGAGPATSLDGEAPDIAYRYWDQETETGIIGA